SRLACQKSPARDGDIPRRATKHLSAPARVPLRGATWPAPRAALQCLAAVCPRNALAKTGRRKRPPHAAETQNPSPYRSARIGQWLPWAKAQFTEIAFRVK